MKLVNILDVDFDTPSMKILDWGLTAASLVIFIFTFHWIWLVGAILGAVFSWYRPVGRFQRFMKGRVIRN